MKLKWALWQAQADAVQQMRLFISPVAAGGVVEGSRCAGRGCKGWNVGMLGKLGLEGVPQSSSSSCRPEGTLLPQEQQGDSHLQQA